MLVDTHRNAAAEFQDRGLKVGVGEGGDGAAVVADEVVVVAFAGADRFVAGHRLSDLEFLDEVEAFELVQDAVMLARPIGRSRLAERVFDLDRGEGAGLGVEQFEQRFAGGAGVVFGLGEDVLRVLDPVFGWSVLAISLSLDSPVSRINGLQSARHRAA